MRALQLNRFVGLAILATFLHSIGFGLNLAHSQTDDQGLVQRFLSEAPEKWEQYEKLCGSLQGKVIVTVQINSNPPDTLTGTYKSAPNSQLEVVEDNNPEGRSYGKVMNPKYSFMVEGTKDKKWKLADLKLAKEMGNSNLLNTISIDKSRPGDLVHLGTLGSLSELIKQPNFKVIRATRGKGAESNLVRIEFDNKHPMLEGKFFPIQSGTISLDPDNYWCLKSAELKLAYQGSTADSHISMAYRSGQSGFSVPEKLVENRLIFREDGTRCSSTYQAQYDLDTRPHAEPKEFILTAFGLAEPAGLKEPGNRNAWFYGGILVLGLLALSFTLWNLGKTGKA